MAKQQLTGEERQDLANAISKLSEEDQMQIAAAGTVLNDEICEKLKSNIDPRSLYLVTAYGMPDPLKGLPRVSLSSEEFKKALEEAREKRIKKQTHEADILPQTPGDIEE